MITEAEYTALQAAIATAETERAALEQLRRDCIEKAREFNAKTREATNKITGIDASLIVPRQQVAEYVAAAKAAHAAKLQAERAAKEKAAAEAKAAEQSELDKAKARIAELEAAAK